MCVEDKRCERGSRMSDRSCERDRVKRDIVITSFGFQQHFFFFSSKYISLELKLSLSVYVCVLRIKEWM